MLIAVGKDDTATVQALLSKGADVNAKDKEGRTSLMFTLGNSKEDTAQVLLGHGADANAKDYYGCNVRGIRD